MRLNPDELAAMHKLARKHDVPASALVRGWILQHLTDEDHAPTDTASVVNRLQSDVRALRRLVASYTPTTPPHVLFRAGCSYRCPSDERRARTLLVDLQVALPNELSVVSRFLLPAVEAAILVVLLRSTPVASTGCRVRCAAWG